MELKNRTVVVTGASGGIGSALCKELDKVGARLILTSENSDKLQNLVKTLDGEVEYVVSDFTNIKGVQDYSKFILKTTDTVDILFNIAGIGVYKGLEDVSEKEWNDSFAINTTAPYFLAKEIISALKKSERGTVVNIGSGMSEIPSAGRSVYCATKSALQGLTLSLAEEYRGTVQFVHIMLGSTLTEFGPLTLGQKEEENLKGKSYLTPEWVAKKFIEIVSSTDIEDEIELYPSDYKEVR